MFLTICPAAGLRRMSGDAGAPRVLGLVLMVFLCPAMRAAESTGLRHIELTLVDPAATGYGTFQSHNQKVVANRRGILMTHIRTRNEP